MIFISLHNFELLESMIHACLVFASQCLASSLCKYPLSGNELVNILK